MLTPPADPRLVGWWSGSARPGAETGSAVLTAHTVHTGGGAFDRLADLVTGDLVRVRLTKGVVRYTVASVRTLDRDALAAASPRLFRSDVRGRLVLITCSGWNGSYYVSNTVVIAHPLARAKS